MNQLKAFDDRVIVWVDVEEKNNHQFSNGVVIRIERKYNNLNKRETEPINATVIDSTEIPAGSEILCHHNAFHEVHQIFNYKALAGDDIASSIRYYAVPINMCYLWRNGDEWQPLKGYATALRVFRPIKTQFYGIAPQLVKDTLFITSGGYKNYVCHTVRAADYQIVFQDKNGREGNLIRCRHFEGEQNEREEIIAVNKELTEGVLNGEIYVGLTVTDAKPILEYA